MTSFELNKISAAILLAGIIAMLCGFIAETVVHPKPLAQPAYVVAGVGQPVASSGGAAAPAEAEPIGPLLAKANPTEGANIAKQCAACHTFDKGGPNRVGPNLYGVIGAAHAHLQGYSYSKAMEGMHDKKWDYEELNKFLANPKGYAPGTKMTFAGLRKAEQRADVIAFLRSKADSPLPLP
jgi:cytochrome c